MSYQDDLDRAGFAVRDKVGKVLSSGSEIISLRDRASQFRATSNAQVNAQAEAVVSKATGLLNNYKKIEADSITQLGKANDLRAKMDTDPVWKSINSGNTANFGWELLTRVADYVGQAASVTQGLLAIAKRCDDHMTAVAGLRSDVSGLEDFAQGKGFKATVSSFGGFALSSFSSLKWIGIGALAIAAIVYLPKPRRSE